MRPVSLERGAAKYAEGSCLAAFGETRVLCTVSVEDGVPGWKKGRGEGWLTVGAVLDAEAGGLSIVEDRPLTEVLSSESFGKLGAVMAVDREGVLRGVLTADRVRRALQSAFGGDG